MAYWVSIQMKGTSFLSKYFVIKEANSVPSSFTIILRQVFPVTTNSHSAVESENLMVYLVVEYS